MDNWLKKRVDLSPHQQALVFGDNVWTFQELAGEVNEFVKKLVQDGFANYRRVALIGNNTPDFYFAILALQQMGIQLVFLNKGLTAAELDFQLNDAKPDGVIYAEEFYQRIQKAEVPAKALEELANEPTAEEDAGPYCVTEFNLHAITSIMYTSGTTGRPKGVLQTFGNHYSSAIGADLNLPTSQSGCWICAVPLFHISGFSIMMRSLIYGMSVKLYSHFDAESINHDLVAGLGNVISVVPYMLKSLLQVKTEVYYANFSYMLLGGGGVDIGTLKKCRDLNVPVIQSYGMTETASQVVALNFGNALEKIGSVGKPLFPVSLKIAGATKANQVGEVLLKGENISPGYLHMTAAEQNKCQEDRWFKTGDLGYLDEDGFLFLKSRMTELIISGGENIYPAEVENALIEFPGIDEAAVVGRQDDKWGNIPVAFIVAGEPVDVEELTKFLRERLAKFKIPKEFHFVSELPKTANGKVKRNEL